MHSNLVNRFKVQVHDMSDEMWTPCRWMWIELTAFFNRLFKTFSSLRNIKKLYIFLYHMALLDTYVYIGYALFVSMRLRRQNINYTYQYYDNSL